MAVRFKGQLPLTIKDFVGLSTDTKPIDTANVGSKFYETDTGNEYLFDGVAWQEYKMKYKDLGLVIDAVNLAAGAALYTSYYDNLQWVRRIRFMTSCDQIPAVAIGTKDTSGAADWGALLPNTNQSGASWHSSTQECATSTGGGSALGARSMKFGIKNTSASLATIAKLRVQLFGL